VTTLLDQWGSQEASDLQCLVADRKSRGLPVQDFIGASPFDHGFQFDPDLLQQITGAAEVSARRYSADPLGRREAREAVASALQHACGPDHVVLTPGTSLAYYYLFRLLAVPGGEVLCPAPTYPLFDDLARLAGLRVRRYYLEKQKDARGNTRWAPDLRDLQFQVGPRTRAIVVVSPHNPTGTVTSRDELAGICDVANAAGVPVVFDEVFRSYLSTGELAAGTAVPRPAACGAKLSFVLNGISKSHYLPGWKAGWVVVEGTDAGQTRQAIDALEYLSDTFLPVHELSQCALKALLGRLGMAEVHRLSQLQRGRLEQRLASAQSQGWTVMQPQAGPYICLDLSAQARSGAGSVRYGGSLSPATPLDETIVTRLLTEQGTLFHPGHLYQFSPEETVLVSTIYNPSP